MQPGQRLLEVAASPPGLMKLSRRSPASKLTERVRGRSYCGMPEHTSDSNLFKKVSKYCLLGVVRVQFRVNNLAVRL